MAFVPAGDDIAVRVGASGRLRRIWDTTGPNKGNPRFDTTKEHAVWISVFARRGQYWADQTGTFGSLVYTLPQDPKATPQKFVSYAEDGVAPLVALSRIQNPKAYATRTFDRLSGVLEYQTADGKPQAIRPSLPII